MLNLASNATALVVAGAWNPSILSPSWVAKNAWGQDLGPDFPVKLELSIADSTQQPTYEFEGVRYNTNKNRISFYLVPEDACQVEKSISTVLKILELLTHTPVSGFGFNFVYEIDEPSPQVVNTFRASDIFASLLHSADAEVVVRQWSSTVKTEGRLLTLNSQFEGGKVALKFNFHFEVSSAADAVQRLKTPNLFDNVKGIAFDTAQKLINLEDVTW